MLGFFTALFGGAIIAGRACADGISTRAFNDERNLKLKRYANSIEDFKRRATDLSTEKSFKTKMMNIGRFPEVAEELNETWQNYMDEEPAIVGILNSNLSEYQLGRVNIRFMASSKESRREAVLTEGLRILMANRGKLCCSDASSGIRMSSETVQRDKKLVRAIDAQLRKHGINEKLYAVETYRSQNIMNFDTWSGYGLFADAKWEPAVYFYSK